MLPFLKITGNRRHPFAVEKTLELEIITTQDVLDQLAQNFKPDFFTKNQRWVQQELLPDIERFINAMVATSLIIERAQQACEIRQKFPLIYAIRPLGRTPERAAQEMSNAIRDHAGRVE